MAIDLQDAILKAVETLTDSRIDKLQLDKTITATVVQCTNALTGEYKLSMDMRLKELAIHKINLYMF